MKDEKQILETVEIEDEDLFDEEIEESEAKEGLVSKVKKGIIKHKWKIVAGVAVVGGCVVGYKLLSNAALKADDLNLVDNLSDADKVEEIIFKSGDEIVETIQV